MVLISSASIYALTSCTKVELYNEKLYFDTSGINTVKSIINDTDYIPPPIGKKNNCWYGNRNKKLMGDSCRTYGNGLKNRYRYGWKWQN